jgi:Domain of unknown function (DUF1850)
MRMVGSRRLLALGAVAVTGAAAAGATVAVETSGGGSQTVVVRDRDGDTVTRLPLPADGRFALAYRHSYYGAPAEERFVRDGRGFRLEEIASPRAAVLDYYALDGPRGRDGGWLTLRPRRAAATEELALIATGVGRRTLVAGDRRVPLHDGAPRHLTIAVEKR